LSYVLENHLIGVVCGGVRGLKGEREGERERKEEKEKGQASAGRHFAGLLPVLR